MMIIISVALLLTIRSGCASAKHEHEEQPFVGEEFSKEMSHMTPEQTKAKLEVLIKAIDKDKDGFTDEDELRKHIKLMQQRYLDNDLNRSWSSYDEKSLVDGNLPFSVFVETLYGRPSGAEDIGLGSEYKEMLARDELRWKTADLNKDEKLSKDEYKCFLHPESCDHMKDLVVAETLKDIDLNNDSMVDLEEYIRDMYHPEDYPEQTKEPEWVEAERKMFVQHRDKDNDGKLNADELKAWLMPDDFDHADAEAKHLISVADDDKDGKLSMKEILDHYEAFAGSQATDYGEQLQKHDPSEL